VSGLIAGIVGGIVIGYLSHSHLSVSGPAAGLATIVFTSIGTLGSYPAFLLSVMLAGLIQVGFGVLKAGTIGHFFPVSVIRGMLAAIGVILILKQFPHAVGYDEDFEGDFRFLQSDGENTFSELLNALNFLSMGSVVVSVLTIAVMVIWSRPRVQQYSFFQRVPSPLVVVTLGVLLNELFARFQPEWIITQRHLVSVPHLNGLGALTGVLVFPDFSQWMNPQVYVVAATLAIVASLETLLSIEAIDKMDPERRITPLNRELHAQGIGNMLSGLLGGLPITSVIVRSSANVNAGARTKYAAVVHGIILLLSFLLIPAVLNRIPLACLAGILIVTGYKLASVRLGRSMYNKGLSQFLPFAVTVIAIVFTDLLQGVFIGLLVSVFFILKTNYHEAIHMVQDGHRFVLKLTKDVSFLNKASLRHAFRAIPDGAEVIIDGTQSQFVDHDITEVIEDFLQTSKVTGVKVELRNIRL
jgi:MFS superfamily sulfate permease-like transporter